MDVVIQGGKNPNNNNNKKKKQWTSTFNLGCRKIERAMFHTNNKKYPTSYKVMSFLKPIRELQSQHNLLALNLGRASKDRRDTSTGSAMAEHRRKMQLSYKWE